MIASGLPGLQGSWKTFVHTPLDMQQRHNTTAEPSFLQVQEIHPMPNTVQVDMLVNCSLCPTSQCSKQWRSAVYANTLSIQGAATIDHTVDN